MWCANWFIPRRMRITGMKSIATNACATSKAPRSPFAMGSTKAISPASRASLESAALYSSTVAYRHRF
ncbi:hypothetical protein IEO21_11018 [Rhodonia placenta]|uniref:Uncharacterized protein n=1 Tax=Rhodonia placenta TaxID=104341 RepID=A0A8H7TVP0_9APHY|nr:hypothetical protein IEO21_11018 [Postia placenta]